MTSMSRHHSEHDNGHRRRRNIIRTALILAAVVFLIYAIFVGQGIWSYFAS
jgi:uncharacterized membrane protein YccC